MDRQEEMPSTCNNILWSKEMHKFVQSSLFERSLGTFWKRDMVCEERFVWEKTTSTEISIIVRVDRRWNRGARVDSCKRGTRTGWDSRWGGIRKVQQVWTPQLENQEIFQSQVGQGRRDGASSQMDRKVEEVVGSVLRHFNAYSINNENFYLFQYLFVFSFSKNLLEFINTFTNFICKILKGIKWYFSEFTMTSILQLLPYLRF